MARTVQYPITFYMRNAREIMRLKLHARSMGLSVSTYIRDLIMLDMNNTGRVMDNYLPPVIEDTNLLPLESRGNSEDVISSNILESKDQVIDRSMFEDEEPHTPTPTPPNPKSIFPPASPSIENLIKDLFDEE